MYRVLRDPSKDPSPMPACLPASLHFSRCAIYPTWGTKLRWRACKKEKKKNHLWAWCKGDLHWTGGPQITYVLYIDTPHKSKAHDWLTGVTYCTVQQGSRKVCSWGRYSRGRRSREATDGGTWGRVGRVGIQLVCLSGQTDSSRRQSRILTKVYVQYIRSQLQSRSGEAWVRFMNTHTQRRLVDGRYSQVQVQVIINGTRVISRGCSPELFAASIAQVYTYIYIYLYI